MKKTFIMTLAAAALVFTGCASTKTKNPPLNKVYVTNTNKVPLLPPDAIDNPVEQSQFFEGSFGEQSFASTLYLQADNTGITVLILNDMMIEIGSIVYDGQSCTLESSFFPNNLKPEYIILDLQNAYCNVEKLKAHYKKYGLQFTEYDSSVNDHYARKRDILKKDEVIETITLQDGEVEITNLLRGYSYYLSLGK